MCYLVYTNIQRQSAVMDMTVGEVRAAKSSKSCRIIWVATTNGLARITCNMKIYQLLVQYMGSKGGADIVFTTASAERVIRIDLELESWETSLGLNFHLQWPAYCHHPWPDRLWGRHQGHGKFRGFCEQVF